MSVLATGKVTTVQHPLRPSANQVLSPPPAPRFCRRPRRGLAGRRPPHGSVSRRTGSPIGARSTRCVSSPWRTISPSIESGAAAFARSVGTCSVAADGLVFAHMDADTLCLACQLNRDLGWAIRGHAPSPLISAGERGSGRAATTRYSRATAARPMSSVRPMASETRQPPSWLKKPRRMAPSLRRCSQCQPLESGCRHTARRWLYGPLF